MQAAEVAGAAVAGGIGQPLPLHLLKVEEGVNEDEDFPSFDDESEDENPLDKELICAFDTYSTNSRISSLNDLQLALVQVYNQNVSLEVIKASLNKSGLVSPQGTVRTNTTSTRSKSVIPASADIKLALTQPQFRQLYFVIQDVLAEGTNCMIELYDKETKQDACNSIPSEVIGRTSGLEEVKIGLNVENSGDDTYGSDEAKILPDDPNVLPAYSKKTKTETASRNVTSPGMPGEVGTVLAKSEICLSPKVGVVRQIARNKGSALITSKSLPSLSPVRVGGFKDTHTQFLSPIAARAHGAYWNTPEAQSLNMARALPPLSLRGLDCPPDIKGTSFKQPLSNRSNSGISVINGVDTQFVEVACKNDDLGQLHAATYFGNANNAVDIKDTTSQFDTAFEAADIDNSSIAVDSVVRTVVQKKKRVLKTS